MVIHKATRRIHDKNGGIEQLKEWLAASQSTVGFTGAGVSTESGVPDFRTPNSPWMKNKPLPFDVFMNSAEARQESWRRKFVMDDLYSGARPGVCHMAMAEMVNCGPMSAIITQNIDGLHQMSGVSDDKVVELHGNGTYATCLACGLRHELADIRPTFEATGKAPVCVECGGIVKSAIISFGQAMPEEAMLLAQDLTLECDLFLAIGSSLVVFPAAGFPMLAKEQGARLVIVNREATDLDDWADLVIRGEVGEIFGSFLSDAKIPA